MLNKRAQILSFELVFITIFMCVTALSVYHVQSKNFDTSVISPVTLLEEQDLHDILAIQEKDLLLNSVLAINQNWDEDSFRTQVENKFFENLEKRQDIISKAFNNISAPLVQKSPKTFESIGEQFKYLKSAVYFIDYEDGTLRLTRVLTKFYDLEAIDTTKVSFVTRAIVPFNNQITLKQEDTEFYTKYHSKQKMIDLSEANLQELYQLSEVIGIENNPTYPFTTFRLWGEEGKDYEFEGDTIKILDTLDGRIDLKIKPEFQKSITLSIKVSNFNYFLSNKEGTDLGNGDLQFTHGEGTITNWNILDTRMEGGGELHITNGNTLNNRFYIQTKENGNIAAIEEKPTETTLEIVEREIDLTTNEDVIILETGTTF